MLGVSFSALLSHWLRHPLQLSCLFVSLCLATALWSSVQIINGEARKSYAKVTSLLGEEKFSQLISKSSKYISETIYVKLRREGWLVSPILEGQKSFGDVKVRVVGIDPLSAPPQDTRLNLSDPKDLKDFIGSSIVLYVGEETASLLKERSSLSLRVISDFPPGLVITDIRHAQKILDAPGRISRLLLWTRQPREQTPLRIISSDLMVKEPSLTHGQKELTDSFHLNLTAFGFLAFAVGLFVVHSAIGLAFEQRLSMFRTMRALGLSRLILIGLFVLELLVIALLAGIFGVLLGYIVAAVLLPDVAATLRGLYGAHVKGVTSFQPNAVAGGIAISILGTFFAAGQLIWRLYSLPILASAQPQAWLQVSQRTLLIQSLLALLLSFFSYCSALYGSGLSWSFFLLGSMLLASAMILPLLIILCLKFGLSTASSPLALWFWSDARQQLSGLSFSLMALLVALAANIGVGSMVSSFKSTFTTWLDQRLASELYVSARSNAEGLSIQEWLKSRTDAILPISNVDREYKGVPISIYGISNHFTYREKWPIIDKIPEAWDSIASGEGVLVNEQMAYRQKLKLRELLTLPDGLRRTIVGIYSDYGNPTGQILMGLKDFYNSYPEAPRLRFAIRVKPSDTETLATQLRHQFNLPENNVVNQSSLKKLSQTTFDRTFQITKALNILTLGVAAISMFASLLTLSSMRIRQMAPLWAMGITRSSLVWLEIVRNLFLSALTAVLAIPLGVGVAWVLLSRVNLEAFGWRLPLSFYPSTWLLLLLIALLASAVASLVPSLQLARTTPSRFLKVFSYEY